MLMICHQELSQKQSKLVPEHVRHGQTTHLSQNGMQLLVHKCMIIVTMTVLTFAAWETIDMVNHAKRPGFDSRRRRSVGQRWNV